MLDFNQTGNKLTRVQKSVLQLTAKSRIDGISKISDITDIILDDKVLDRDPDYPFHFAMYLDDDFGLAQQRKLKNITFRNLDEFANPVALSRYAKEFPEAFYHNDWIVTSGRKKGSKITRPSKQLLGDSIYGAALCLYSKRCTGPFYVHPREDDQLFHEVAYEFYVNGSFTQGYYKEHIIPIYVHPNGKVSIGEVYTEEAYIADKDRLQELDVDKEQSEDLDYEVEDYDDYELEL